MIDTERKAARFEANINIYIDKRAKDYTLLFDKVKYKRSGADVKVDGGRISIKISARDATALFATINSVMKQFAIISKTEKLLEQ
ncbi:MAG: KEOPS complex subunit Pcc1 [Candidatus Micrarchaeia archaeon]